MAKQSIVAVIRAKPNERGRTSHLPIYCGNKGCNNEILLIKGTFNRRKRICAPCYTNPPQKGRKDARIKKLQSMGLI